MGKHTIGKEIRKEGRERERIYTVIQCDVCGTKSYERKQRKIEEALKRQCRNCIGNNTRDKKAQQRLTSGQDRALLEALRSIHRLLPKRDKRLSHGLSGCRTYKIWKGMMDRCYNPKNPAFYLYGEKGVRVCERWHDIKNFIEDMGSAPDGYSLERNDVNGNYEPLNCRWIPKGQQSRNRRNTYGNRNIVDGEEFKRRKQHLIRSGAVKVDEIPYGDRNGLGWWRAFGLYTNPYIYGPMPWKGNGVRWRRMEAIERGWFVPLSERG
jgi:hypothetical protein